MGADDCRDCRLSFLFLRYLSDNYETAAKKELGKDYPDVGSDTRKVSRRAIGHPLWLPAYGLRTGLLKL